MVNLNNELRLFIIILYEDRNNWLYKVPRLKKQMIEHLLYVLMEELKNKDGIRFELEEFMKTWKNLSLILYQDVLKPTGSHEHDSNIYECSNRPEHFRGFIRFKGECCLTCGSILKKIIEKRHPPQI